MTHTLKRPKLNVWMSLKFWSLTCQEQTTCAKEMSNYDMFLIIWSKEVL